MKITVSAPGKIHLSGEHSVVYGKPAILASISKRLYVTLEDQKSQPKAGPPRVEKIKKEQSFLAYIVRLVEKRYKHTFKDFCLTINSDISVGGGLGSSAALAAAVVGALREYLKLPWDVKAINELAYEAEKYQHGTPSGGDNSVVSHGGLLWYRKEFEFLKTFWLLPFKIPVNFNKFLLINTGRSETTGEMVRHVAQLPKIKREKLLHQIEDMTKSMLQAIHDEKRTDFADAIRLNQKYLEQLGVVSTKVKELVRQIENLGGAGKITGAGGIKTGSGMVLAMHEDLPKLQTLIKKSGFNSFMVQLNSEGVKRERIVI